MPGSPMPGRPTLHHTFMHFSLISGSIRRPWYLNNHCSYSLVQQSLQLLFGTAITAAPLRHSNNCSYSLAQQSLQLLFGTAIKHAVSSEKFICKKSLKSDVLICFGGGTSFYKMSVISLCLVHPGHETWRPALICRHFLIETERHVTIEAGGFCKIQGQSILTIIRCTCALCLLLSLLLWKHAAAYPEGQ